MTPTLEEAVREAAEAVAAIRNSRAEFDTGIMPQDTMQARAAMIVAFRHAAEWAAKEEKKYQKPVGQGLVDEGILIAVGLLRGMEDAHHRMAEYLLSLVAELEKA